MEEKKELSRRKKRIQWQLRSSRSDCENPLIPEQQTEANLVLHLPANILLFSALVQTNSNITCIFLLQRYQCPLLCIELGKINKRQSYVSNELSHLRVFRESKTPQRHAILPCWSSFQGKQLRTCCSLLVTILLQQCLQISGCSRASAADVPKVEKNRVTFMCPRFPTSSGLVNISFMIIFYLMKQKFCCVFSLNAENSTFKRWLIFRQNMFSNVFPTQIPILQKDALNSRQKAAQKCVFLPQCKLLPSKDLCSKWSVKKPLHLLVKPAGGMTEVWVTMDRNVFCSINTSNIV